MKLARDLPEFYQETKPEKLVGARGYGGGATMSMVVASEGKDWKMNWISRVLVGWECGRTVRNNTLSEALVFH